jgi:hypothetical protein
MWEAGRFSERGKKMIHNYKGYTIQKVSVFFSAFDADGQFLFNRPRMKDCKKLIDKQIARLAA